MLNIIIFPFSWLKNSSKRWFQSLDYSKAGHLAFKPSLAFKPLTTGLTIVPVNNLLVAGRPCFLFLTIRKRIIAISTFFFEKQKNDFEFYTWKKCWKVINKAKLSNSFAHENLVDCRFFWKLAKIDTWLAMYNLGLNEKKKWLAASLLVYNTKHAFNRQLMAKRHLVSSFETSTILPLCDDTSIALFKSRSTLVGRQKKFHHLSASVRWIQRSLRQDRGLSGDIWEC